MAVQFILGRAGTGKTTYCINQIVDELSGDANNVPLVFLVPEQATYQAERAILNSEKVAGFSRLRVLSFERLGFLLSAKNSGKSELTPIARQMAIQKILINCTDRLKVFKSAADRAGTACKIAEVISELFRQDKTIEQLDKLTEKIEESSALKFSDIRMIFDEYLKFLAGGFADADLHLSQAKAKVKEADFLKGARVWIDGFSGFTEAEFSMLRAIFEVAVDVKAALCLDSGETDLDYPEQNPPNPDSIFYQTQLTYGKLVALARQLKQPITAPVLLADIRRFNQSRPLAHIEKSLFGKTAAQKIISNGSVNLVAAANIRNEVDFTARQIIKLVSEKNFRYRDIAVIVCDINKYQHYIRAAFDDFAIPFFIDVKRTVSHLPIFELLVSALNTATQGFRASDVVSFLKTGLSGVKRQDVDLLENYCLAFGIDRDVFLKGHWDFAAKDDNFDEKRINQIKDKALGQLIWLKDKLALDTLISAEQFHKVVFEFLNRLDVPRKVNEAIEQLQQRNQFEKCDEYRQFLTQFSGLMDDFARIFDGCSMSPAQCVSIVINAMSNLNLKLIPPTLDSVLVGSIERSRHPNLKAVFVIGATQNQFPVPLTSESILTEADRTAAVRADFELSIEQEQKLIERQYLAYIALTRAAEYLFVSYPAADEKDSPVVPTDYINKLVELFCDLKLQSCQCHIDSSEDIVCVSDLADFICANLNRYDTVPQKQFEQAAAIFEVMLSKSEFSELADFVDSAINYNNRPSIDGQLAERLFTKTLTASATRLRSFASCPYKHFAKYVLRLQERADFKCTPLDIGEFYHGVLENLFYEFQKQGTDFSQISKEQLTDIFNKVAGDYIADNSFLAGFTARSAHNRYIIASAKDMLLDAVIDFAQSAGVSQFRQVAAEIRFAEGEQIAPVELELADNKSKLVIKGKIDRLDIAEVDGRYLAAIFDYKSSSDIKFDWCRFYHGIDMQLVIYLLAAKDAQIDGKGPLEPIGAFYLPITSYPEKTELSKIEAKSKEYRRKARGLFDGQFHALLDKGEPAGSNRYYSFFIKKDGKTFGHYGRIDALEPADYSALLGFAKKKLKELAEQILDGDIEPRPYRINKDSPCKNCPFAAVCRFDWRTNSYNFMPKKNKQLVIQSIEDAGER